MMKLLVVFAVIGACVAYPSEPNPQIPQDISKPIPAQSSGDLPPPPQNFLPGGPYRPPGGPHRPAEVNPASNGHLQGPIPVGTGGQAQPLLPPKGDSDLKTDSSFWRSYYNGGYPSWYSSYYSSPRYYSSYYTPYTTYSSYTPYSTYSSYYPSNYYWY